MIQERRRYFRLPATHLVEFSAYEFTKEEKKLSSSNMLDVSAGGVLIRSSEPAAVGSLLKLSLNIPGWEKYKNTFIKYDWKTNPEPLSLLGYVVRVEELVKDTEYEIGVIFECIDEDHREALTKYIEGIKKQEAS